MPPAVAAPPPTQMEPVTETLHGVEVTDPYRWLEDQNSPRTRAWIEEQTAYTRAYFDSIPGREQIRERVRELMSFKEVISEPWNIGDRYFFLKRREDAEQPVIVMREGLFGNETTLVDPALRGTSSSTAVAIGAISHNARFLAYSVRHGGTDHSAIEILDIERNSVLPDCLLEGFCWGLAFATDNSGFYYSYRALNAPRPNYRAVLWHRFGTDLADDHEIFFAGEEPNLFLGILHSPDAKLLAYSVYSAGKHPHTSIYLHSGEIGALPRPLLRHIEGSFVPFFVAGQLLAYTDFAAPNFRIVLIDTENPDPTHWRDVVPESSQSIRQAAAAGDHIFVTRTECFSSQLDAFGLDGTRREGILFPQHGSIDLVNATAATDRLFYKLTSISKPPALYCYDTQARNTVTVDEPNVQFDPSVIVVEEVTYTSKDASKVPLLLASRKDLLHSSPLPTFLTGYGGFGSCVIPRFTAFASFLIECGFLFAVPALRGGSELGEQWHLAGRREKRQNSFDDFIAAAEWLISEGRAAPGHIAIGGGSNAGLLVGAVITQRPDLFRAAICLGPLLDMTRYQLFDFAAGWADEYGSPEDEYDFHCLLSYSPYHRVKDGTPYPAVLLISGDADTRCNPMHARKMAARLQTANTSTHPILLDYKPDWGHTPVQPLSKKIDALTDRLVFVCHELGVHLQRRSTA
ncbi:MAG: prolyl oligopeptidase family serine peptidase [Candidatus Sulfotelmatobacter sp.]